MPAVQSKVKDFQVQFLHEGGRVVRTPHQWKGNFNSAYKDESAYGRSRSKERGGTHAIHMRAKLLAEQNSNVQRDCVAAA